jgi:ADP-ribose pyrophosphatase YjhB (NUDIX family)
MKRLLASRVKNLVYRIIKGKTVGVRALIIKGEKTLLVKHSYRPLWYMPGGGVDAKETGIQAVRRELEEEVNISCENFELFGFYHSEQEHHDDYVALYVTHLSEDKYKIDEQEIAQANWFSFDELPQDISPGTKRRIEEYLGKMAKSDKW